MYMLPARSSATAVTPQKPAAVAGPPSPRSVPPPATVIISPSATAGVAADFAGTDAGVFAGADRAARSSPPPQAAAAHDTEINSGASRHRPRTSLRGAGCVMP